MGGLGDRARRRRGAAANAPATPALTSEFTPRCHACRDRQSRKWDRSLTGCRRRLTMLASSRSSKRQPAPRGGQRMVTRSAARRQHRRRGGDRTPGTPPFEGRSAGPPGCSPERPAGSSAGPDRTPARSDTDPIGGPRADAGPHRTAARPGRHPRAGRGNASADAGPHRTAARPGRHPRAGRGDASAGAVVLATRRRNDRLGLCPRQRV
jgi:hypothetical protein